MQAAGLSVGILHREVRGDLAERWSVRVFRGAFGQSSSGVVYSVSENFTEMGTTIDELRQALRVESDDEISTVRDGGYPRAARGG